MNENDKNKDAIFVAGLISGTTCFLIAMFIAAKILFITFMIYCVVSLLQWLSVLPNPLW